MRNRNLLNAKKRKNDEFYTLLTDIEKELSYYKDFFKGKVVYCNCDDYRVSNFIKYFKNNFHILGIKKLLASNYDIGAGAYCYEFTGEEITIKELEGSGDFRSEECIEFLKEADVVVTNPPFSIFREYVKQLMDYGKKFIIVGSAQAITYKEIFPYIKNNQMWLGATKLVDFKTYSGEVAKVYCYWYGNVTHNKRNTPIDLYKRYSNEYPHYENYDAIEVGRVENIPADYNGIMGVPLTFMQKYNPAQFEIVGMCENEDLYNLKTKKYTTEECKNAYFAKFGKKGTYDLNASGVIVKNGKLEKMYSRILIRKRTA